MPLKARIDAIPAHEADERTKRSNYPASFARRVEGRVKRPLGDLFGLRNFGVNLTSLLPGAHSALQHRHSRQDELVYVLSGRPTLVVDDRTLELTPGMVAGFAAGTVAHHLENRTTEMCVVLEVGDRTAGDEVAYPDDDLQARAAPGGGWIMAHKDGSPYDAT